MQSHGKKMSTHKISFLGMTLAVALILSYVESLIPFNFSVPGIKLGLANACIVIVLSIFGYKEALIINILRIILAGFMFGNLSMIMYSAAGAILSMIFMIIMLRINRFSLVGVSMVGAIAHNLGQCLVASAVVENFNVMIYFPVLVIVGAITGGILGIICNSMLPVLRNIYK